MVTKYQMIDGLVPLSNAEAIRFSSRWLQPGILDFYRRQLEKKFPLKGDLRCCFLPGARIVGIFSGQNLILTCPPLEPEKVLALIKSRLHT
jgi:hypothetical protein